VSTSNIRQRAVIVAIPAVAGVVTAIAVIGWRTTLPDPLAIHFGANGRPDGSAGRNIFLWLTLNVTLVVIAIGVAGTLRAAGRSVVATWAAGTACWLGWWQV
jgi:nitric oxide reductase large subunit